MDEMYHRTKVVSLKLTPDEYEVLRSLSGRYNLPPSTVVYLIVKEALSDYELSPNKFLPLL